MSPTDPLIGQTVLHYRIVADEHWVLVVMMDPGGKLTQCRVVPFDGSGVEHLVGPKDAVCTTAAWSPDGKWIYLSTNQGGSFHIWRQRFPSGEPEQVTSGPTEEEGIAMASDGNSFITSVGTTAVTIWIHDKNGDRQLSSEGSAFETTFAKDGTQLYYLKRSGQAAYAELWRIDLPSGQNESVFPGYEVDLNTESKNYAISADGKRIVFVRKDEKGNSRLWMAPTDRRSSPRKVELADSADSPGFLPNGDLMYRAIQSGANYLYTSKQDGTGERKVIEQPILDFLGISPSGKWAMVGRKVGADDERPYRMVAYPIDSGNPVLLCRAICTGGWDPSESHLFLNFLECGAKTYFLNMGSRGELPKLLERGLTNSQELNAIPGVKIRDGWTESAISTDVYSFTRATNHRNLFRIPVP